MKRKLRKRLIIVLSVILIALLGIAAYIFFNQYQGSQMEGEVSMKLGDGLEIVEVGPYTGAFVEDGTNAEVSDVLMVVIRNNGSQTVDNAELTMRYGEDKAKFFFSTLLPEQEIIVLEEERLAFSEENKIRKLELENIEFFEEEISMYEEEFQIMQDDWQLEVENVSGDTVEGPVTIYYKNLSENGRYIGGITYSVVVEDDVDYGEIITLVAENFTLDNSEIMYVTVGE